MSPAKFAPLARRDLQAAARWIARENPTAARALRLSVSIAAKRIGRYPLIGVSRPDLAREGYRFLTLTGFPYVMVYDSEAKPPLVLRVLHGARDLDDALGGR